MAYRFLSSNFLPLILAFTLVLSCSAAANVTASANHTTAVYSTADNLTAASNVTDNANSTAPDADAKAKFLCTYTYNQAITKAVTIDKNTNSFSALQAQIASFFPDMPNKFKIYYGFAGDFLDNNQPKKVEVVSDEDVRNLMAEYEASLSRVPIDLYAIPPEGFELLIILGLLIISIIVIGGVVFCCICYYAHLKKGGHV